jgi:hypothetical protein
MRKTLEWASVIGFLIFWGFFVYSVMEHIGILP